MHRPTAYSTTRIEDDDVQFTGSYDQNSESGEDIASMLFDIDNEIARQHDMSTESKVCSIGAEDPCTWRYPIEDHLFTDINHHARTSMYVNLYVCPYQVRLGTDNTPFVQFIMQKKNVSGKNLRDHANNYMDFYCKTYFEHHTTKINFLDEVDRIMKLIMLSYGKVLKEADYEAIKYKGFIKRANDFYVFVDISHRWVNHHYLKMNDHLWLASLYEIWGIKEVCSVPISDDVSTLFLANQYLTRLYHTDGDEEYSMPVTGFTVQDNKNVDLHMMVGTSPSSHRDIPIAYVYYYDYNDCCYMLSNNDAIMSTPSRKTDDELRTAKNDKVIMRNYIMYDKRVTYDEYLTLSEDEREGRVLIIDNVNGSRVGFVVCNHGCQTPVNSHDALLM